MLYFCPNKCIFLTFYVFGTWYMATRAQETLMSGFVFAHMPLKEPAYSKYVHKANLSLSDLVPWVMWAQTYNVVLQNGNGMPQSSWGMFWPCSSNKYTHETPLPDLKSNQWGMLEKKNPYFETFILISSTCWTKNVLRKLVPVTLVTVTLTTAGQSCSTTLKLKMLHHHTKFGWKGFSNFRYMKKVKKFIFFRFEAQL